MNAPRRLRLVSPLRQDAQPDPDLYPPDGDVGRWVAHGVQPCPAPPCSGITCRHADGPRTRTPRAEPCSMCGTYGGTWDTCCTRDAL